MLTICPALRVNLTCCLLPVPAVSICPGATVSCFDPELPEWSWTRPLGRSEPLLAVLQATGIISKSTYQIHSILLLSNRSSDRERVMALLLFAKLAGRSMDRGSLVSLDLSLESSPGF